MKDSLFVWSQFRWPVAVDTFAQACSQAVCMAEDFFQNLTWLLIFVRKKKERTKDFKHLIRLENFKRVFYFVFRTERALAYVNHDVYNLTVVNYLTVAAFPSHIWSHFIYKLLFIIISFSFCILRGDECIKRGFSFYLLAALQLVKNMSNILLLRSLFKVFFLYHIMLCVLVILYFWTYIFPCNAAILLQVLS